MVEESKSSNRTLIIVLAVAALVLALGVGIVAAVVILGGDDTAEGAEPAQAANIMPEDTLVFASFNPHLDQAENYEVIKGVWGDNPIIQMGLAEMLSSMEKDGFSYKEVIEPWLGDEISFGMLGDLTGLMFLGVESSFGIPGQPSQTGEMPEVPQFVVAIAIKDGGDPTELLNDLRARAEQEGTNWQETDYKDVRIVHSEADQEGNPGLAYATINDFLVLAVGGLEPMQAVIDARDGTNLADIQEYQDALAKLPAGQIGYGYVDIGAYMDAFMQAAGSELAGVAPELIDPQQYEAFRSAGFSAGFEPNGLRVDFVTLYDKDALPDNVLGAQAISDGTANRVPASTLVFLAGSGLGDQVQNVLDAVKAMPGQPEDLDEQLQMMTALLGVSWEELIEMLSGDFGLAIAPDPAGIAGDPSVPIGVSFMLEAEGGNADGFKDLVNSISALLTLSGEMELESKTISGVEVTMIPDPFSGEPVAGVGVGGGYFVIATSEELLEAAFSDGGDKLAGATTYQDALAPLPETRSGLFFMDLDGFLAFMQANMDPTERESFAQASPVLEPIKSISAAAEPFDDSKDSMSGVLFFLIESE